jgi:hypothetical protein
MHLLHLQLGHSYLHSRMLSSVRRFQPCAGSDAAGPADAKSVAFGSLPDGATVDSPVHLEFKVEGMEVKPGSAGLEEGAHERRSASPHSAASWARWHKHRPELASCR